MPASELSRKFRSGAYFSVLNRAVVNAVPAFVILAAVRLVPGVEFGIYNVLLALGGLVSKATSLGWPEALARYLPRLDARQDRRQATGFILEAMGRRLLLAAALVTGLVAGFSWLGPLLKLGGYGSVFRVYGLVIILMTQNLLLTAALEALLQQRRLFISGALANTTQVAILVGLFLQGGSLRGLVWMEAARAAVLFVAQGAGVARTVGLPGLRDILRPHRFRDPAATRYRWLGFLNDLGTEVLSTRSDYLMLSYLATNMQVAVYSVAARLMRIVDLVVPVGVLKGALESVFYRAYERNRTSGTLNLMFQGLTKVNLTFLGFLLAVAIVHAPAAFTLVFGPQYGSSGTVFIVFIIFLAMYYYPLGFVLRAIERMDLVLWGKTAIILNIVLAILWVPRWGALGMALATTSAQMSKNIFIYWTARRLTGLRMPWPAIARLATNVAITVLVLVSLRAIWGSTWIGIVLGIAVALVVYLLVTYFNAGFNGRELRLIIEMLPERVARHRLTQALVGNLLMRAPAL